MPYEGGRKPIPAAAAAKSLQPCPTLCNPIDGSPPGSAVPGILQARTLEWVAISFSNAWEWKLKVKSLSCVRLLETSWTAAYQAPPSMGFFRQEYWSGVPLPSLTSMLGKYKQAFESNRKRYWNFLCLPATDWGYQEIQIRPSSCDQWNWQRRGYKNKDSMPSTWYNAS